MTKEEIIRRSINYMDGTTDSPEEQEELVSYIENTVNDPNFDPYWKDATVENTPKNDAACWIELDNGDVLQSTWSDKESGFIYRNKDTYFVYDMSDITRWCNNYGEAFDWIDM